MRPRDGRERVDVDRDDVVRHEVAEVIEPERRELREHLALVGNAGAEDVVERGDAIGRDDQQVLAEIVDVADLAAARERETSDRFVSRTTGDDMRAARRNARAYHLRLLITISPRTISQRHARGGVVAERVCEARVPDRSSRRSGRSSRRRDLTAVGRDGIEFDRRRSLEQQPKRLVGRERASPARRWRGRTSTVGAAHVHARLVAGRFDE